MTQFDIPKSEIENILDSDNEKYSNKPEPLFSNYIRMLENQINSLDKKVLLFSDDFLNNLKKASTPLEKFSLIVDYRIEKQRLFELNKEQIKEFTTEYGLMVLAYKIYKGLESAVENIEDGDLKKEIEDMMVYIEKRDLVKLFWEGDKKSEIAEILNESGVERAQEIVERFFEYALKIKQVEVETTTSIDAFQFFGYPLFSVPPIGKGEFEGEITLPDGTNKHEKVEILTFDRYYPEEDCVKKTVYLPLSVGDGEEIHVSGVVKYL